MKYQKYLDFVNKHKQEIYDAEDFIWKHPETGYNEWETSHYLENVFEKAGYVLNKAGDIPGFYTDIDTGKPGPKVMILAELDALAVPNHYAAVKGNAHACGHCAQCAAMVGIALALKEPGALDGLSGSIRLVLVPAEEGIQLEERNKLRKQGVIHFLGGKDEFLYRGYFDGVDLAYMFHTGTNTATLLDLHAGCNGCLMKDVTYYGVGAHAGSCPDQGVNALYAATLGLNAINALRETFKEENHIRVHPIITNGGEAVSIIPSVAKISTFIRGRSLKTIQLTNKKVNRALASGALAMGATMMVNDYPGFAPLNNSEKLREVTVDVMSELVGREKMRLTNNWGNGSTDMGNLSCIMPVVHPYIAGAKGTSHGVDFHIADVDKACVLSAQGQLSILSALLSDNAKLAKEVVSSYTPLYASKEEYFKDWSSYIKEEQLLEYDDNIVKVKLD